MCDYCGCRRQAAIEELSDEHERILDLGYELRRWAARGDHAAARAVIADELAPIVRRHTVKEEAGVFAELRRAWEADDRLDALVDEHRSIEELLATAIRGGAGWQAEVEALVATLAEHIVSEETDLFPYSLYELDPEQWEAIDAVHAEQRAREPAPSACTAAPTDPRGRSRAAG